jgi:5-methylcytosine-specific restriction endonuclease McrA
MAPRDPSDLLREVQKVIADFETHLASGDLRDRVMALVPSFAAVRELGKSLVPGGLSMSARDRLLAYFKAYPGIVLSGEELSVVAGISEWARRVRELRVELGWKIVTGVTTSEMMEEDDLDARELVFGTLSPNDYVLLDGNQDRDAAYRWRVANDVRKQKEGSKAKILSYLRLNVGKQVTGEELRYVARSTEWARRTRELRTEEGWPIVTRQSGNPQLPIGVYVLEKDQQAPTHDRHIRDSTRRRALQRDHYTCRRCGWHYEMWNPDDPRFLELHHIIHHAEGGSNELENLVTYCNVCHDEVHRLDDDT